MVPVLATVAFVVAACGSEDEAPPPEFSGEEEQIAQVGNDWAPAFAVAAAAACGSMFGQPLCEEYFGKLGSEVEHPSDFQKSFADATVERVEIRGHKAGVEFSNGELVEFIQETHEPPPLLGDWFVYRVGGNAGEKYFEP
jgi:hypothetical protein